LFDPAVERRDKFQGGGRAMKEEEGEVRGEESRGEERRGEEKGVRVEGRGT